MAGWAKIDATVVEAIPEIGLLSLAVYVVLASHSNAAREAWPSVGRIAQLCGVTRRGVQVAMRRLEKAGLIQGDAQSGKASRYVLTCAPTCAPPAERGAPTCAPPAHLGAHGGAPTCAPPAHLGAPELDKEQIHEQSAKRFYPPSGEEVKAYCQSRSNGIDPARFVDYYIARGWKLKGGTAMKDWRAAVRTWEGNRQAEGNSKPSGPIQTSFS